MEEKKTMLSGKTLRKPALMVALLVATLSLSACVIPHDGGSHRDGWRRHNQWNNDNNWNGGHHRRPNWQGNGGSWGGGWNNNH